METIKKKFTFKQAVKKAEFLAKQDWYDRWCVVKIDATYNALRYSEALDNHYEVICVAVG